MAALLKDAIKPNLVQTLEHTPVIVHGGPFANIAHGCNSVRATKTALGLSDYTVTEAGFGADLGAEKFLDIKCRTAGIWPNAVVIVATVRSLKYNAGIPKEELNTPNAEAVAKGFPNLAKHIENILSYGIPCVVASNQFLTDTPEELDTLRRLCEEKGAKFAPAQIFAKGGEGGIELANAVLEAIDTPSEGPHYMYELDMPVERRSKQSQRTSMVLRK
jgi:formate--tetrahydrofolate ligase